MRILVVDDLEINRNLLVRRVQRLGHQTGEAANGRDALARLREQDWDLVLLDITMPEMDGYQTLQQIRADPRSAQLPVVMVSAIDESESVVRCLELGADDYLPKPFNPVVLQARIASSLAKKRLQDHRSELLQALSRELQIGQRIQQGFLPSELPPLPGWSLGARCTPARQVGGDFYDAYPLPNGLLALVVADVCDKGVGAALYMALFRTLLRAIACQATPQETPPATLLRSVVFANDYIATVHGHENMFATLFFALLAPASGELHHINAGHEAALLSPGGGAPPRPPPQRPLRRYRGGRADRGEPRLHREPRDSADAGAAGLRADRGPPPPALRPSTTRCRTRTATVSRRTASWWSRCRSTAARRWRPPCSDPARGPERPGWRRPRSAER